ncbi:unnamed protein product [Euphydryas editha]|uniref:DDE Tnp4 domain-containing protein n=1 Tax=Euphydryas editha TaxID=104508 RepID=A0AAU9TNM6_EUPED|nr:unnamed protein product [Euphydryas editha]
MKVLLKGPNETCSFLLKYIQEQIPSAIKELYLFTDCCGGQNRNHVMISLCQALVDTGKFEKNYHRFPVRSHSFLPNDRSFGTVKKILRKRDRYYHPMEICEIICSANENFTVSTLETDDILDFTTGGQETCEAIIQVLKDYIKLPQTNEEWEEVAKGFEIRWNAPHILGAIDGKHVEINKPPGSGSYYYNYKKQFSIVLMAIVNANYEFIMVDVGTNGRVSDGGVLQNTKFGQKLRNNDLNIPRPAVVNNSTRSLPPICFCRR